MKRIEDVTLTPDQSKALSELKHTLREGFDVESLVLYGSVVRGEADDESDVDILVVTTEPMDRRSRHRITDAVFEVNLRYDTNFSTLVIDRDSWEHGPICALPIKGDILSDGVPI